jgi:hypothetical protein
MPGAGIMSYLTDRDYGVPELPFGLDALMPGTEGFQQRYGENYFGPGAQYVAAMGYEGQERKDAIDMFTGRSKGQSISSLTEKQAPITKYGLSYLRSLPPEQQKLELETQAVGSINAKGDTMWMQANPQKTIADRDRVGQTGIFGGLFDNWGWGKKDLEEQDDSTNVTSTKGLTTPALLNADLWKDAGGRVLTTPSSFSKEFEAAKNATGNGVDDWQALPAQKTYSFESPKLYPSWQKDNNVLAPDWMNTEMNAVEQFGWDTFRPTSMEGYLTGGDESYLGYTDESKNNIGWHTKDPSLADTYQQLSIKRGWSDPRTTPGMGITQTQQNVLDGEESMNRMQAQVDAAKGIYTLAEEKDKMGAVLMGDIFNRTGRANYITPQDIFSQNIVRGDPGLESLDMTGNLTTNGYGSNLGANTPVSVHPITGLRTAPGEGYDSWTNIDDGRTYHNSDYNWNGPDDGGYGDNSDDGGQGWGNDNTGDDGFGDFGGGGWGDWGGEDNFGME